jgi:hypothetical protein
MRTVFAIALVLFSTLLIAEDFAGSMLRSSAGNSSSERSTTPQALATHQILRDSALIFAGTVLSIDRPTAPPGNESGITKIRFRVENAIRGVRAGQVIEVREWGGLWNAGERYRQGENVLLFLYPISKLGLTSPVAGAAGLFRVDKNWRVQVGNANPLPRPMAARNKQIPIRAFADAIRREAREKE